MPPPENTCCSTQIGPMFYTPSFLFQFNRLCPYSSCAPALGAAQWPFLRKGCWSHLVTTQETSQQGHCARDTDVRTPKYTRGLDPHPLVFGHEVAPSKSAARTLARRS